MTLTMCVNYGGRAEIADAARAIALKVAAGELRPDKVTEKTLAAHLDEPDMPDVDLFWRSSGEQRSSNFLPWQAAYAEYVFSDVLWPDVNRTHLWAAIEEYARRNRRFGAAELVDELAAAAHHRKRPRDKHHGNDGADQQPRRHVPGPYSENATTRVDAAHAMQPGIIATV